MSSRLLITTRSNQNFVISQDYSLAHWFPPLVSIEPTYEILLMTIFVWGTCVRNRPGAETARLFTLGGQWCVCLIRIAPSRPQLRVPVVGADIGPSDSMGTLGGGGLENFEIAPKSLVISQGVHAEEKVERDQGLNQHTRARINTQWSLSASQRLAHSATKPKTALLRANKPC